MSSNKKDIPLTNDEIIKKLEGYVALKNDIDKKMLLNVNPYRTWIRYYNLKMKQFRIGGLLQYVDPELRYITLLNKNRNYTWNIQLVNVIIFIKDYRITKDIWEEKLKENAIKEKLFKLYKSGKLKYI